MKNLFDEPTIEVIKFSVEDIITTSNQDPDENAGEKDPL